MSLLYFEDFPLGEVVEFGDRLVTAEEIVEFARQFDPQPFHLDEDAARGTQAGGLIASGWHTASLLMRMSCDEFLLRSASRGSPGVGGAQLAEAGAAGRPAQCAPPHAERAPPRSRPGSASSSSCSRCSTRTATSP